MGKIGKLMGAFFFLLWALAYSALQRARPRTDAPLALQPQFCFAQSGSFLPAARCSLRPRRAGLANPALATMRTATRGVRVAGDRGRAPGGSTGGGGCGGADGYLVGEEARSLFAGDLTFPEQCRQQGMCYAELGSGGDDSDADMLAFVDGEAEEGVRRVAQDRVPRR